MGQIDNLKAKIEATTVELYNIIDSIVTTVTSLPDNPKVKRISPNIVIVNSKDLLGENWTAEFYNFKWQYWAIALYIGNKKTHPAELLQRIESILNTGKIPYPIISGYVAFPPTLHVFDMVTFNHKDKQALHPDVLNNLKEILQTNNL